MEDVTLIVGENLFKYQQIDLEEVLRQYSLVLKELSGLPPARQIGHSITLQPGSGPISVRPYWYPHYQKDVTEWQIGVMQQQGITRDSVSPFSSPVIFVKKKTTLGACVSIIEH